MYNLGFGRNLNYNFLETMALQNHGLARRIYEDSDANLQMQVRFTSQAALPTMLQLQILEGAFSRLKSASGCLLF